MGIKNAWLSAKDSPQSELDVEDIKKLQKFNYLKILGECNKTMENMTQKSEGT